MKVCKILVFLAMIAAAERGAHRDEDALQVEKANVSDTQQQEIQSHAETEKPTCCRCERLIAKKGGMFSSTVYGKDCQVGTSGKGSKVCGPTCAEDAEGPKYKCWKWKADRFSKTGDNCNQYDVEFAN
ncbi:unnamed protein product [Durusdinium trenchii]|uniref:Uncharacterized protein n=1 Tax=Durusdinium trenchii TaxID=1381693 RepID=A0ABP0LNU3_9DINO